MAAPGRKKPLRSLRFRIMVSILLPLIVALAIMIVVEYRQNRSEQLANALVLAEGTGHSLDQAVKQHLQRSDIGMIQMLMHQLADSGDLRSAVLLGEQGVVLTSSHPEATGRFLDYDEPLCQSCHPGNRAIRPSSLVVNNDTLQIAYPLKNDPGCSSCHGNEPALLGMLVADIPLMPPQTPLANGLGSEILWWLANFAAIFVGVYAVLDRQVVERLATLAWEMNTFDPQAFTPLPEDAGSIEIADLYRSFNDMALTVQQHGRENERLTDQLSHENRRRAELLKRIIDAQENERKRIALELHDELGQVLSGLTMQVAAIKNGLLNDPDKSMARLDHVQTHLAQGLDKMYEVILALRPSDLDDLGLSAALRHLADRTLSAQGIQHELHTDELNGRLATTLETALYRIYQEAITNVLRHSEADFVHISLERNNGSIQGAIADNGRGFHFAGVDMNGGQPRGLGLLGMQERITQVGGSIEVRSAPGAGTRVQFKAPIQEIVDG